MERNNVTIIQHPLIQHKISILRNKETGTNEFRTLVEEIAMLMGYEAFRDLPTELVEVETPIETTRQPMIAGKKLAVQETGCGTHSPGRSGYGQRYIGSSALCKGGTHRSIPG